LKEQKLGATVEVIKSIDKKKTTSATKNVSLFAKSSSDFPNPDISLHPLLVS